LESDVVDRVSHLSAEEQKNKLFLELMYERELNKCFGLMYGADELSSVLEQVLGISCGFLQADRGTFFFMEDGSFYLGGNWSAPGVEIGEGGLNVINDDIVRPLVTRLAKEGLTAIESVMDISDECPKLFETLCGNGVKSAVLAPVRVKEELCACILYYNPRLPQGEAFRFLSSLIRFMSISVEREKKRKKLAELSYVDVLTGCHNRTKFYEDVRYLSKLRDRSAGVIYIDVNGLKKVNDIYAHEAGDELLRECAEMLVRNCPGSRVYRVGGDEFVVLESGISNDLFALRVNLVRKVFEESARCNVAIGSSWMSDTRNIKEHISIADREMYRNKREYYSSVENDRRSQR